MTRWTDLATWRPTEAHGSDMHEYRGLVLHIAEGFYEGTIAWQKNKANKVSSHFVLGRGGLVAQLVDTDEIAWTQQAGNGHWLSAECEGFTVKHKLHRTHPGWEKLSAQQIESAARLLVRAHHQYGVPLQLATTSGGRGLGHHSMGGRDWGHLECPGPPIIAQKAEIIRRAKLLTAQPGKGDDDMDQATFNKLMDGWSQTKTGLAYRNGLLSTKLGKSTVTVAQALQNTEIRTRALDNPKADA